MLIKLSATEHVVSHRFTLSPSTLLLSFSDNHCTAPAPCSMATETTHAPPLVDPLLNDVENDSGAESTTLTTSEFPTHDALIMAKGEIPVLMDFFKKSTISNAESKSFHDLGWLTGNLISSVPEVDIPTVDGSIVLYFESHLLAELGLPPSKFLSCIMSFLGCASYHFNANALAAISTFVMLREC
jgi:hypothetical protein